MGKEMNIATYLGRFECGHFDNPDFSTQCEAGWYDWFCSDKALARKTKKLTAKLKAIVKSEKIDPLTSYVFFKNNCPVNGPLYDDFRICSIEEEHVIYTITPKCGHSGLAEVWGRENNFECALVEGTWDDVKTFFGTNKK